MRTQNILAAVAFTLSSVSFSASAAIINQVDFPEAFVQAKQKAVVVAQDQQVTAANAQK